MCIGIPGKVILMDGKKAKIKMGDHSHWVDISALGEEVKQGDFLITYQNTAINKLSQQEAEESLKLLDSLMHSAGNTGVKSSD